MHMENPCHAAMQKILDMSRLALSRGDSPLVWAVDVARCLQAQKMQIPSVELGHALASFFFASPPSSLSSPSPPSAYLHHAMASNLVSSFHVLAVLMPRVLQARITRPDIYAVYLELVDTYIFRIGSARFIHDCDMMVKAVDEALHLSQLYGVSVSDFGTVAVQFLLTLIWRLMDATLEDWGVLIARTAKQELAMHQGQESYMEVDQYMAEKQAGQLEQMHAANCIAAIDLVSKIIQNKMMKCLLRVAYHNLADQWGVVTNCLQAFESLAKDVSFVPLKGFEAKDSIGRLIRSYQQGLCQELKPHHFPVAEMLLESRTHSWYYGNSSELGRAAMWLPIDIFMEDVVAGRRVQTTFVVEALADLVKALQLLHNCLWQETFLALWLSALRLLQRELDEKAGPEPLSESRLSVLLSIVPLVSALIIDEEEKQLSDVSEIRCIGSTNENDGTSMGHRRAAFISSLKILGQFEGLISPPQHVISAAYQAAVLAAATVAGYNNGNMCFEGLTAGDTTSGNRTVANLRHLIVETCMARGLTDTSAYYWPGYVSTLPGNISATQTSPWNAYMEGASLGTLKNLLTSVPAKSVAQLEKVYQAAINGPEDERVAAASILCGASLMRSWSIQEHAISYVFRLLSPPPLPESRANNQYLVSYSGMLHATLLAISSNDVFHILSLYGMFPTLAARLLPICEVFGSLTPQPAAGGSKEEVSVLALFSLAFLILIKMLKFHKPSGEHRTPGTKMLPGMGMSLDYLLTRYNAQIVSLKGTSEKAVPEQNADKKLLSSNSFLQDIKMLLQSSSEPITMDSFPRLKAWFLQHQSCTAASFSGLPQTDTLHQVADKLLGMMMKKSTKTGATTINSTSEESGGKPMLPGWDLLTAVPFVVDALLTACAHDKLLPRDLTTGLRELVDFFPASLSSISSYLEVEVTRGLWKPVPMNGKDWPSPAANLLAIEAEIRDMLAALGITTQNSLTGQVSGNALVTLPLPIAAFLSLTITYKVDKQSDNVLSIAGPALQNIAGGCTQLSSSVVSALWVQKVRRWHEFIVFGAVQSAVKQDKNAVIQLLRSCFVVTLGTGGGLVSKFTAHGGVGALLGHGSRRHALPGHGPPVPPGFLYLCICPFLHDVTFLPSEILSLLVTSVRELCTPASDVATPKSGSRLRCVHPSLATVISRVSQASTLATSLLIVSGGSTLVHLLWVETLPALFLVGQKSESKTGGGPKGANNPLLEGYGIASFALLAAVLAWGASKSDEANTLQRRHAVDSHVKFVATALDGKVSLACEQTTWMAYVTAFVSLLLSSASGWVSDLDVESLKTIADALRMWQEHDLALALMERGGLKALGVAGDFVLSSFLRY